MNVGPPVLVCRLSCSSVLNLGHCCVNSVLSPFRFLSAETFFFHPDDTGIRIHLNLLKQ